MKSINLLPKYRQQDIRLEAILGGIIQGIIFTVFSFAVVLMAQFGTKIYLADQAKANALEIEQLKKQVNKNENTQIKLEIKRNNDIVNDYLSLVNAAPHWSKVLRAFAPLPPKGVSINSMIINFSSKTINITGSAPTRELVIKTYNNILADEKEFYNIDYPLENVAPAKDINFHFTFNIKDDLLK